MNNVFIGDTVISVAGRDKGKAFVVVKVLDKECFIVDGKIRKTDKPKRKNIKHVKKVNSDLSKEISEKIQKGLNIGNKKLRSLLKAHEQKS